MLAWIIKAVSNDGVYGLPHDLYKASWTSKCGRRWPGLAFETVKERGMFWLRESTFDWKPL
jgi:hypothetical protein